MKAIVVLRVSTESQEIDSQKAELVPFAAQYGYKEEDLVYVEAIGASAIKLDQKYMEMAGRIKKLILDGGIGCVFVWEISRLGRNEVILMDFKEFFIKHKIQFICKNPSLKLLDDDGSVNTGTELAFSLFSTMSKQEMLEKKARFKRRKVAMAKAGQYIGGNVKRYGYKVVDGFFVEDEEEGRIVKMIFDLYSTGSYSTYSLSKELKERGIQISDGKICKILKSVAYVGDIVSESGMHYPQLVSRELFDKCKEIREGNRIQMKRGEKLTLCAKLVKCPVCGATCTSNSKHYVCSRHAHHGPCTNGFALRQEVADDVAWRTAHMLHMDYLLDLNENKVAEYWKELQVTDEKIKEAEKKMGDFTVKKDRIVDTFLEGLIDKKTRDLRLSKLQDDIRVHHEYLSSLQGKRRAIAGMLEGHEENTYESFLSSLAKLDSDGMYDIIHKHIKSVVGTQESFGKRDPRTHLPNGVRIVVTSVYGKDYTFMYIPKYYQGHNLYVWNGRKWSPDRVTKAVHQFVASPGSQKTHQP